jgi:hypothetical protein
MITLCSVILVKVTLMSFKDMFTVYQNSCFHINCYISWESVPAFSSLWWYGAGGELKCKKAEELISNWLAGQTDYPWGFGGQQWHNIETWEFLTISSPPGRLCKWSMSPGGGWGEALDGSPTRPISRPLSQGQGWQGLRTYAVLFTNMFYRYV